MVLAKTFVLKKTFFQAWFICI